MGKTKIKKCNFCNGKGYIFKHKSLTINEMLDFLNHTNLTRIITEKEMEELEKEHRCQNCKGTGKNNYEK